MREEENLIFYLNKLNFNKIHVFYNFRKFFYTIEIEGI